MLRDKYCARYLLVQFVGISRKAVDILLDQNTGSQKCGVMLAMLAKN